MMVERNITLKYQHAILGFAWNLLGPLMLMGLLITVFTQVVGIPIENYWAFLISGYFSWHFFSNSVTYSANVLDEHATLIRNFSFPYEIAVCAGALSRIVEFLVQVFFVSVVLSVFHRGELFASVLFLPVLVVLQLSLVLGPMLVVATVSALNDDLKHMLPLLLTALFYATPVFYSVDLAPESIRWIYYLNPVAQLLICYQHVLYVGGLPPIANTLTLTFQSLAMLTIGYFVFDAFRGRIADVA
jgi:ABC-type polysaccharide/polyol phosphate export permease